ncbi:uncharacterized protein LOC119666137 [Teleopsis dalmanni]|uniref:uncharacterized protein LOC119666137 n=1 Tax=Teleopsis dalmanni TaxID=139649 RepID=UPI0018CE08BE|nr:uncharacterized protein LOC119666137 [Teleopsis dalmanni]
MTSDSFLAALKRLFARRGKCSHIYSDNGTNFVGASKKLDKDLQQAIKSNVSAVCALEAEGIKWHFIPPAGPHFGGLWESAVKSIKHHLKRVVGENKLTYEELSTLLTQIEGILNSRPLCANVDDNDILTPGHFLIGHAIIDYPEAVDNTNISSLNRWKIIQAMKKHFWKRWKEEYLTNLQQRYKWKKVQANVKEGQVVIVKNEETYPGRWPLGKIIEVHPGKDNLSRSFYFTTNYSETVGCSANSRDTNHDMPINRSPPSHSGGTNHSPICYPTADGCSEKPTTNQTAMLNNQSQRQRSYSVSETSCKKSSCQPQSPVTSSKNNTASAQQNNAAQHAKYIAKE